MVNDSTPVKLAPLIAGSFALPSNITILFAVVPVSSLAVGKVPVAILEALVVSVVADVASPAILEAAIAASDLTSALVIVLLFLHPR